MERTRQRSLGAARVRLLRLEIEDFALIARATLEFDEGFTVCTGETGSGKTMLLGALGFVLGERASPDVVRASAARARVSLEVACDGALRRALEEAGLATGDDESAVLSREIQRGGKSTARVNGRLVTTSQVRDIGGLILETVGQHEAQRLLSQAYQQEVLDAFAGDAAIRAGARVGAAYERVRELDATARDFAASAGRALADLEFARYSLGEIDAVAALAGEDHALRERRDYLANVEKIATALSLARELLTDGESSSVETLGSAAAALAAVARYAPDIERLASALAALQSDATDLAVGVGRALEDAEFDPAELESVTARLDAIERLKKKFGGSIEAIAGARAAFAQTIERETMRDEREAEVQAALANARLELAQAAALLAKHRAEGARALERRMSSELAALAMPAARFGVTLAPLDPIGPRGGESVAFELSPNPGEPLRPLARAASGGELSRVLLALVVTVAERRDPSALVFDEIDAGIGGATATAVGVRLGALARRFQVLCVTHLAQIATWADRHYALRKREIDGATVVEIEELRESTTSLAEIARMLSGSSAGVALEHAEALLREVRSAKSKPVA